MKNISKKHLIIGAILCAILLIVASVVWVKVYEQHKVERAYSDYKSRIEELENKFGEDTERSQKLEILKTVINDAEEYKNADKSDDRIIQEYDVTIKAMRTYFIKGYDAVIEKYSYGNRPQGEDSLYEEEIESLSDELKLIEEEKGTVSTEEEVEAYKKKIESSISKYEEMAKENAENMSEEQTEAQAEPIPQEEQPSEVDQLTKDEAFQLIIDNVEFTYDVAESQGWEETPREHMYNSDATWGWWYSVQSVITDVEATVIDNDTIYVVVMVQPPSSSYEPMVEGEYTLRRGQNSSAGQQASQENLEADAVNYSGLWFDGESGGDEPTVITKLQFEDGKMLIWGNVWNGQSNVELNGKAFEYSGGFSYKGMGKQESIDALKGQFNGGSKGLYGGTIMFDATNDLILSFSIGGA